MPNKTTLAIIQKYIVLATGAPGSNTVQNEVVRLFEQTNDLSQVAELVDTFMSQQAQTHEKGIVGVVQSVAYNGFGLNLSDQETQQLITNLRAQGIDSWSKLFAFATTAVNENLSTILNNRSEAANRFTDLLAELNKDSDYDGSQATNAAHEWIAGIGASNTTVEAASNSAKDLINNFFDGNVQGRAFDGYISGATVFIDTNQDGELTPGEISTTTDALGYFMFQGDLPDGNLIVTGGTDIATNLPFTSTLSTPQGAFTLSPLSTLVNQLLQNKQADNIVMAEDILFQSLNVPRVDLSFFDPISVGLNPDASAKEQNTALQLQATTAQVSNLLLVSSTLIDNIAGDNIEGDTMQSMTSSLLDAVTTAAQNNKVIDLTEPKTLQAIITVGAANSGLINNTDTPARQIATVLAEINTITQHSAENNSNADVQTAFSNIIKLQTSAQTQVIPAVVTALETGDLSTVVTEFTDDKLINHIDEVISTGTLNKNTPVNDGDNTTNNSSNPPPLLPDNTAPKLTDSSPPDNTSAVAIGSNVVLTFSETVVPGMGNIIISDGTDTRTIAISDATQVNFSGNTITINPTADLNFNTTYNVQMASGVTTDTAGNAYAGINDNNTLNFTTTTLIELSAIEQNNNNDGFVINGVSASDQSGISVSSAGDVNNDGLADLIVGANHDDPNGSNSGASFVVFGKTNGTAVELSDVDIGNGGFAINGVSGDDQSGRSVSYAGDVNGDGLADLIVGAYFDDPHGSTSGSSFVVFGKTNGTVVELSDIEAGNDGFVINGVSANDQSGHSVSSAGDVNGDGLADLIIGARYDDPNGANSGASFVIFGKTNGTVVELSDIENGNDGFVINGVSISDQSGRSVSGAGDVNGDGLMDLVVGASGDDPNGAGSGASFVIFGKTNGTAVELSDTDNGDNGFAINGVSASDYSGLSVSDAGDVNGDGFADLIVGALLDDPNGSFSGASFVVFGKTNGTAVELSNIEAGNGGFVINGVSASDFSGLSVSSAGDVNGDGLTDLIVGASGDDPNGASSGASFIVFGKTNGTVVELSDIESGKGGFVINGVSNNDNSGLSVSSAGDVNGDGFADLIVGAFLDDPNGNSSGASFVIFGGQDSSATIGTSSNDTLNGDGNADQLVAGTGNDTLIGNGGTDVLRGGAGDDILAVSDLTFASLDGGTGTDTLRFDTLLNANLGSIANSRLSNLEIIDLNNTGSSLTLSTDDILTIMGDEASNDLRINGSNTDSLNLSNTAFSNSTTTEIIDAITYDIYQPSASINLDESVRLLVQQELSVSGAVVAPIELSAVEQDGDNSGFVINGVSADDQSGASISNAGDVNGDGLADLIVGAAYDDPNNASSSGASFVVFGKTNGTVVELSNIEIGKGGFAINGVSADDQSGHSVSNAGDVNGDGYSDVIVGAHFDDPNGNASGASFVVFGKTNSTAVELSNIEAGKGGFVINGANTFDLSGFSVSSAGDVNGDGMADLIIGAPFRGPNGPVSGASFVVFGKTNNTAVELSDIEAGSGGFVINGVSTSDESGHSVSNAGDVNGDGMADLIIGASYDDTNGTSSGTSFVVFGKTDGTTVELSDINSGKGGFVIHGASKGDLSGFSVSNAGDVNGDGFADLIVGALNDDPNGNNSGASFIVFGKTNGTTVELSKIENSTDGFVINGASADDQSGRSVSGAGDVNGDGFDDLIVGVHLDDPNGSNSGATFLIFGGQGSTATVGTSGNDTLTGDNNANQLVAGAGNDTLIGNSGADVLRGGAGNDILAVSDLTFTSLNGGAGTDTLRLDTALNLDFRTLADPKLSSIETIDLTSDSGNSIISLNITDVLNLSGTQTAANTLVIHGSTGDIVNLDNDSNGQNGTWSDAGAGLYEFDVGGSIGIIGTVTIDATISVNFI